MDICFNLQRVSISVSMLIGVGMGSFHSSLS